MGTRKVTRKYLQTSDKSYQTYKEGDKSRVIEVTFTKTPEVWVLIALWTG